MYSPTNGWAFRVPPGWPVPPAGWAPPAGWHPDPSWPTPPADWVFWVPARPVVPAQRRGSAAEYWPTQARSKQGRGWLMALFVVGLLGTWVMLAGVMGSAFAWNVDPADYPTEAAYDAAWSDAYDRAMPLFMAVVLAGNLILFGLLGQRAGYRGAGFLLVFVPFYGYVVMARILWRWTDIKHWDTGPRVPVQLPPLAPIGLPHHQRTY